MSFRNAVLAPVSACLMAVVVGSLAGCGGTNPTDTTNPYNRSSNQTGGMAPGGIDAKAASPQELLAVNAVVAADQDAKRIEGIFTGMKKLGNPPKRMFLLGATAKNIEGWIKPAKTAKIDLYPVPGTTTLADWKTVLVKCGRTKAYGNGPNPNKPNADQVTSDQGALTSSIALEGVRYVVLNTQTPTSNPVIKGGNVPTNWINSQLAEAQKNNGVKHVVFLADRPAVTAELEKGIANPKEAPIADRLADALVKNNKVRGYFALGSNADKSAKVKDNGPFQVLVSPERFTLIEVYKNGALRVNTHALGEDPAKSWTALDTLSLFEPAMMKVAETGPTPGEVKAGDAKPSDMKVIEGKIGDVKPTDPKTADPKTVVPPPVTTPPPGK